MSENDNKFKLTVGISRHEIGGNSSSACSSEIKELVISDNESVVDEFIEDFNSSEENSILRFGGNLSIRKSNVIYLFKEEIKRVKRRTQKMTVHQ